ncbi:MAG: type II toxin-antitoxin system RelE/ParE family toxin [Deltaproteobacteria bacterium]|nr:type II toxin-antitoxin system RelE/ParE family toxin [Deltaproteobacteria bacterium]
MEFYESREPGLGFRFRDLVVRAFEHIDVMPEAWPPYVAPGVPPRTRHVLLKPFQESVVYVFAPDPLVVAIAHAKRRPGYWARRLRSAVD